MNEAKSRCVIRPVTIGDRPASQHDVRQLSVSPSCTSTLNAFARSHANDQLDEPPWLQSMTSPVRRKLFAFGLAIQKRPVAARRRPTLDEGWVCLSCRRQAARGLANIRDDNRKETRQARVRPSFEELQTSLGTHGDRPQPDARTLQLGKTVSVLHDRLPTLLASPLPSEILSPQITLHLFPSTHPHLPTVSGRIAYLAALWTAPVAWGRVPVLGNIRLVILSERMVKNGGADPRFRNEKLIVRWRTCGKTKGRGVGGLYKGVGGKDNQVDKITEFLGGDIEDDQSEFCGLFVFEFDEEGRMLKHTIEHAQEGGNFERMTRVVSVTDWLIGLAKRKPVEEPGFALGYCETDQRGAGRHTQRHRDDDDER